MTVFSRQPTETHNWLFIFVWHDKIIYCVANVEDDKRNEKSEELSEQRKANKYEMACFDTMSSDERASPLMPRIHNGFCYSTDC